MLCTAIAISCLASIPSLVHAHRGMVHVMGKLKMMTLLEVR